MMKRVFAKCLLLVAVFACICASAAERTVSCVSPVDYSSANLVPVGTNGWLAIAAPNVAPRLEPVGAPQLPVVQLRFAVPAGAEFVRFDCEADWATIGEGVRLMPVQAAHPGTVMNAPWTVEDAALYAGISPAAPLEDLGSSRMSGVELRQVAVTPFRYNGATGRLEGAKRLVVTATFAEGPSPRSSAANGYARDLIERVKATVVNPGDVSMSRGGLRLSTSSAQPDYILIAPHDHYSVWSGYVAARQADHPEITMLCKDFSEVLAAYPVNTDDATKGYYARNDAERLHAYVRAEFAKGTRYFVLAGAWYDATKPDAALIGADGVRYSAANAIPGIACNPRGGDYLPSDTFYACCDIKSGKYPWDPDENGVYGNEPYAQIDVDPDVAVSRLSFKRTGKLSGYTLQQLADGYLAKVRKVESKTFDGRAAFAFSTEYLACERPLAHELTCRDEMEFHTGAYNVFHPTHLKSWADMEPWAQYAMRDRLNKYCGSMRVEAASLTTWAPGKGSQKETLADIQSKNFDFVFVAAHGAPTGTAGFSNSTSSEQKGLFKIFAANEPCYSGYPDYNGGSGSYAVACNSETLVENPNGGAAFAVGCARTGFFMNNPKQLQDLEQADGLSMWLANLFAKGYAEGAAPTVGDVWLYMQQNYGNRVWQGGGRFAWAEQMPYGDPYVVNNPLEDQTYADGFASRWAKTDTVNFSGSSTVSFAEGHTALNFEVTQGAADTLTLAGGGSLRVTRGMTLSGGNLKVNGLAGGVAGEGVEFTGHVRGNVTFAGSKPFYVSKLKNAGTVTLAGQNGLLDIRKTAGGVTHDFTAIAFGAGASASSRNSATVRSDKAGALVPYLPLNLTNFNLTLETSRAAEGATGDFATLSNSSVTFGINPYRGAGTADEWERLARPVTLVGSALSTASAKVALGDGFALDVSGACSLGASAGGYFTLNAEVPVTMNAGSVLYLRGEIRQGGDGAKFVFSGSGKVVVENVATLAGALEVGGGVTIEFQRLPLQYVREMTLRSGCKVTLPASTSGAYQLMPLPGSHLTVEDGVDFGGLDVTWLENGSVFVTDKMLMWNADGGNWSNSSADRPWKSGTGAVAFTSGKSAMFPTRGGKTVPVSVVGGVSAPSALFTNESGEYVLTAGANGSLSVNSLMAGGDATVNMPMTVSGSAQVVGGSFFCSDLNTPDVLVYGGAEFGADKLDYSMSKIKYIRLYVYAKHAGSLSDVRIDEIYFDGASLNGAGKVTSTGASGSYSNLGAMIDGSANNYEYRLGNDQAHFNVSADQMANGTVYVTIELNAEREMFKTYGIRTVPIWPNGSESIQNSSTTCAPSSFEVKVSADGTTFYSVSKASSSNVNNKFLNGSATAYTASAVSATPKLEVLPGGVWTARGGAGRANVTLNAGAVVKAVPGKVLDCANYDLTWPGSGLFLDTSALTLSATPQTVVTGANFTLADLYRFVPDAGASLRIANGDLKVVKGDGFDGPYTRTVCGGTSWDTDEWCSMNGEEYVRFSKPWSQLALDWTVDVELDLCDNADLALDCDVYCDTFRASTTNNVAPYALTIAAAGGRMTAQTIDLTQFTGPVTFEPNCGSAHVIAGPDTRLAGGGTGVLTVGEGCTVTLAKPWDGTIEGEGTVILDPGAGVMWNGQREFAADEDLTVKLVSGGFAVKADTAISVKAVAVGEDAKVYESIARYGQSREKFTGATGNVVYALTSGESRSVASLWPTVNFIRIEFARCSWAQQGFLRRLHFVDDQGANMTVNAICTTDTGGAEFHANFLSASEATATVDNTKLMWFPCVLLNSLQQPISMFEKYSMTGPNGGRENWPLEWKVSVSADKVNWYPAGSAVSFPSKNAAPFVGGGKGTWDAGWMSPFAVLPGGTLQAHGAVNCAVMLEAGAVLRPVPGKTLNFGSGGSLNFPATGKVAVDVSGLDLATSGAVTLVSGANLTADDLAKFRVKGGKSVELKVENGKLIAYSTDTSKLRKWGNMGDEATKTPGVASGTLDNINYTTFTLRLSDTTNISPKTLVANHGPVKITKAVFVRRQSDQNAVPATLTLQQGTKKSVGTIAYDSSPVKIFGPNYPSKPNNYYTQTTGAFVALFSDDVVFDTTKDITVTFSGQTGFRVMKPANGTLKFNAWSPCFEFSGYNVGEGDSVSVNVIGGNNGLAGKSVASANLAGVIPTVGENWNQVCSRSDNSAFDTRIENLNEVKADGIVAASAMSARIVGKCTYTANGTTPSGGNAELAYGYVDDGATAFGNATIILENIPYTQYDVYVYMGTDKTGSDSGSFGPVSVTDGTRNVVYPAANTAWGSANSTHGTVTYEEGKNYFRIAGCTGATLKVVGSASGSPSGTRCGLAGIQVVNRSTAPVAEPTVFWLR